MAGLAYTLPLHIVPRWVSPHFYPLLGQPAVAAPDDVSRSKFTFSRPSAKKKEEVLL